MSTTDPPSAPLAVLVTGAAGSVGGRVCRLLCQSAAAPSVVALDLEIGSLIDDVEAVRVDLAKDDLAPYFEGIDTVVHLASSFRPVADGFDAGPADLDATRRVLDACAAAGVRTFILLSSAMVYGAHPQNPIPILEDAPLRPNPEFSFAVVKAEMEDLARAWERDAEHRRLVILRPTTALAEGDVSWVARSLRSAALLDVGPDDPPVQFLHLDDLATAVVLAVTGDLEGAYNVAPDGSVDGETCRELSGRVPRLRMPEWAAEELGRFSWRHRLAPTAPGLAAYTMYPWVVANGRLRAAGWVPESTNEQAYVDGTPARPWASMNAKRRQQLALGGAAAAAGALGFGIAAGARALRRRA